MVKNQVTLKGKESTKVLSMPGCPNVRIVWSILANKLFFELVLVVEVRLFWLKSATLTMNGHSISDFSFTKLTKDPFKIALGNVPAEICCTDSHNLDFEVLVEGKVLRHDVEQGSEIRSKSHLLPSRIEQIFGESSLSSSGGIPQIRPEFLRPDQPVASSTAVFPIIPSCATICSNVATLNASPEDPPFLAASLVSNSPEANPSPRKSPVRDARMVESFCSQPISDNIFSERPDHYFGLPKPTSSQLLNLSICIDPPSSPAPITSLFPQPPPLSNLQSLRNVDFEFLRTPNHLQWRLSNPFVIPEISAGPKNVPESSEEKLKSSSFITLKEAKSLTYTSNPKDTNSIRDPRSMNYPESYSNTSEVPSMGLLRAFCF